MGKINFLLNQVLPPFVYFVIKNLYLFIKNGFLYSSNIKKYKKNNNRLIIMGNGPSLNSSLKKYMNKISLFDCMCVNEFVISDYYELIRPHIYIVADPNNFIKYDEMSENIREQTINMVTALRTKTQWPLVLMAPDFARKSDFIKNLNNNNIKVLYYNTLNLCIPPTEKSIFFCWNHNMIPPLAQTVLNVCLNLGIMFRYNEIFLIGADSNWMEDVRVDQTDNRVYIIDKHFYGEKKRYLYSDVYEKVPSKLGDELDAEKRVFESYWILNKYAQYNKLSIYNASEYSLIDAFQRKKIE